MRLGLLCWPAAFACMATALPGQDNTNAGQTQLPNHGPVAAVPVGDNGAISCPRFEIKDRPANTTIQARLTELMDSSTLKPGNEVFAKVLYSIAYPGCSLHEDAILYGHV